MSTYMPMGRRRSPTSADFVIAAVAIILLVHFALSYTGPYRWVAELQLAWFGSYSVKLTLAMACLIIAVPLVFFRWFVARALSARRPAQPPGEFAPQTPLAPRVVPRWQLVVGAVFAIGLLLTGVGLAIWNRGSAMGSLAHVAAADLESGRLPPSPYMEVQGLPLWDAAMEMIENNEKTIYCPFVSSAWRRGQPVRVFLETRYKIIKTPFDRSPDMKMTGVRAFWPLTGPLRARFSEQGTPPSVDYILLTLGERPDSYLTGGRWLTGIGAVLTLVFGLATLAIRLRVPAATVT